MDCRCKTEPHGGHLMANGNSWTPETWTTIHWRPDWRRGKSGGGIHSAGVCGRQECQQRKSRNEGQAETGARGTTRMRDKGDPAMTCPVRFRKLRAYSARGSGRRTLSGRLLSHRLQHTTTPPYLTRLRKIDGHSPARKGRLCQRAHRKSRYTGPPALPQYHRLSLRSPPLPHIQVLTITLSHLLYPANTLPALQVHRQYQANTPTNDLPRRQTSSTNSPSNPPPSSRTATHYAPSSSPRNSDKSSSTAQATTRASTSKPAACSAAS